MEFYAEEHGGIEERLGSGVFLAINALFMPYYWPIIGLLLPYKYH
jgi:hypothetical protein